MEAAGGRGGQRSGGFNPFYSIFQNINIFTAGYSAKCSVIAHRCCKKCYLAPASLIKGGQYVLICGDENFFFFGVGRFGLGSCRFKV